MCENYDIIFLQEHWLLSCNLFKLEEIDKNFECFSVSAMDNKAGSGILVGRPFGGVAVLFRKTFSKSIKLIDSAESEGRYIFFKLIGSLGKNIIFTCVYFPCTTVLKDYIIQCSPVIAHIENILTTYSNDNHFIAGDFNFECRNGNIG